MEGLEGKMEVLRLQEEKSTIMRRDVALEETLCDIRVNRLYYIYVSISSFVYKVIIELFDSG